MTPAELVVVSILLLLFVQDVGKQYQLHKEGWFVATILLLLAAIVMGLFGSMKGFR